MKSSPSDTTFYFLRSGKTALRALHVLGLCGASAGFYYQLDSGLWRDWWILAMVAGTVLLGWEIWRSRYYLVQMKGILTLLKLVLLGLCYPLPQFKPELFSAIVLLSVFTAHGPSQLRHYSPWHGRQLSGKEMKG